MELTRYQELVHLIATPVFVGLYVLRLIFLMRSKMVTDRSPDPKGDLRKGIWEAFITLVAPWKMHSTRKHWTYYLEFIFFHIGIAFNISLAYLVTYASRIMTEPVRNVFIFFIALSTLAGIKRLFNRFLRADMRVISSFDDYFALILVFLFNASGILILRGVVWGSYLYFTIVFLFEVYEPFSKIRHYLYYPFARFFYGTDSARKGFFNPEARDA
jgi:hypothetical protein